MNIQTYITRPTVYLDLQTEDTIIVDGNGSVLLQEPSVLVRDSVTQSIVSWGKEARRMQQRVGPDIHVFELMKNGRIGNETVLIDLLRMWKKVFPSLDKFSLLPIKTAWVLPHRWGQIQKRVVARACTAVGMRSPLFVPYAEALNSYVLGKHDPQDLSCFVLLGMQSSDIYIVSRGKTLFACEIPFSVFGLVRIVTMYLRMEKGVDVGEQDVVTLCLSGISADLNRQKNTIIRGKDHVSQKIVTLRVSSKELFSVTRIYMSRLTNTIRQTLGKMNADQAHDIEQYGLYISGIGSEIDSIDEFIAQECSVLVRRVPRQRQAGVLGAIQLIQKT